MTKYVFDQFTVGSSNRMAYSLAFDMATNPDIKHNPIYLYGGIGVGKTHLLRAIGNEFIKKNPDNKVIYTTVQQFTEEMVNALRDNNMDKFRLKYSNVSLLLMDEIQSLVYRQRTTKELLLILNEMKKANGRIVFSGNCPHNMIGKKYDEKKWLEKNLHIKLSSKSIAVIHKPDLETRIAFLKGKAEIKNINVGDDVIQYLANNIDSNMRELNGVLETVMGYAELLQSDITTDLAAKALQGFLANSSGNVIPQVDTKNEINEDKTSNFAHFLISEVVANPGGKYNPVYLYGDTGAGKTHLLHDIGDEFKKNNPEKAVVYTTGGEFTEELIGSVRDNKIEIFLKKYRNADLLLLDDIQLCSRRLPIQEGLRNIFDAVMDANNQIVISGDCPPYKSRGLLEELRSRFSGGVVVNMNRYRLKEKLDNNVQDIWGEKR
ncbi:Chromosomal replication initiator protein DnaA [Anaerovibrio sp. JC8]|uniref:DnaA/Hda family protein n=1 Tax=Anaerovibrio sp. JC8 TaxID=1240085 RepID=UPI000A097B09|nr:DnaA/Hda family protein [Anaerovibrio sp. JC8]ORU00166.1 Chromosomal replication initiator protein DnaA [Anaerovibrio sp. JC8]